MTPQQLARLSTLLDEAMDLDEPAREAWLARLAGDDLPLAPQLRRLLTRQAHQETGELLDAGPPLTAMGAPRLPDAAAPALAAGDLVGPYRLVRELGAGGMGEVWLAERADGAFQRQVALKLPTLGLRRAVLVQRFARERDILAALEHPHIARLYDAGVAGDGQPYLAMEFVEGQPIDTFCRERALGIQPRLRLLVQVARVVAYAHSRLVIHRDLKPANILVTGDGQVRLLDFGVAKLLQADAAEPTELTRIGGRALTPRYASPEQLRGEPLATTSDVYSLGVVGYELLAGALPYRLERGTAAELEEAVTSADAPLASATATDAAAKRALKGDLDAILNRALKKEPRDRYASVEALADDFDRHLAGLPVAARPDSPWYLLSRFVARHRPAVVIALLLMVAIGTATTVSLWQAEVAREQARIARAEAKTAAAVQDFLESILRAGDGTQLDPIKARQRTASELLDAGVQRVGRALQDEPAAKQRVLRALAEIYWSIERLDESADLRGQRAALLEQTSGPDSEQTAIALAEWADALVGASREDEATRVLDRAGRAAASKAAGPELRLKLDLALANLRATGLREGALEPAQRAVAALLLEPPSGDLLRAMDLLAMAQMRDGQLAAAGETLQRAVGLARGMAGAGQAALVTLLDSQGDLEVLLGRGQAALGFYREAVTVADGHSGPTSPAAAVARYNLGLGLGDLDQPLAGQVIMLEALGIVQAWPTDSPERNQYLPMYALKLAQLLRQAGRPLQALRHLDAAGVLVDRVDALPSFAALWRVERAMTLIDLGRLGESGRELEAAAELVQRFSGTQTLRNAVDAAALRQALALRQPDVADERLQRLTRSDNRSPRSRLAVQAASAEIDLLAGRCEDSERKAASALAEFEARSPVLASASARLKTIMGQARLCMGQVDRAVELLSDALRGSMDIEDVASSPRVAEVRLALAKARGLQRDGKKP